MGDSPIPDFEDLRRRYVAGKQLAESCQVHGFTIEELIDGRHKDIEEAEDLLAFLRQMEGSKRRGGRRG